jgi:hypothetical protein
LPIKDAIEFPNPERSRNDDRIVNDHAANDRPARGDCTCAPAPPAASWAVPSAISLAIGAAHLLFPRLVRRAGQSAS